MGFTSFLLKIDIIIMIGYRGAGKSTLSQKLAQHIGWNYLSSDTEIEKKISMTINQWVDQKGWEEFRLQENYVCQKLAQQKKAVIDLGGGAVENSQNIDVFKKKSSTAVFWIDTDIETLIKQLKKDKIRPFLFTHPNKHSLSTNQSYEERIEKETRIKYKERLPLYQKLSDYQITNKNIGTAMTNILKILEINHTINIDSKT